MPHAEQEGSGRRRPRRRGAAYFQLTAPWSRAPLCVLGDRYSEYEMRSPPIMILSQLFKNDIVAMNDNNYKDIEVKIMVCMWCVCVCGSA